MSISLMLELSDEDLGYFSRVLNTVWKNNSERPEDELIQAARVRLTEANKAKVPQYVADRLKDIEQLLDLLADREWPLELGDRRRILAAVSYFAASRGIISDEIPGIGYLDDAVMADIVTRELEEDLEGYRDFCAYREKEAIVGDPDKVPNRDDWLAERRAQLFDRIQRRRERRFNRGRGASPTPPILQYKY